MNIEQAIDQTKQAIAISDDRKVVEIAMRLAYELGARDAINDVRTERMTEQEMIDETGDRR